MSNSCESCLEMFFETQDYSIELIEQGSWDQLHVLYMTAAFNSLLWAWRDWKKETRISFWIIHYISCSIFYTIFYTSETFVHSNTEYQGILKNPRLSLAPKWCKQKFATGRKIIKMNWYIAIACNPKEQWIRLVEYWVLEIKKKKQP